MEPRPKDNKYKLVQYASLSLRFKELRHKEI